MTNQQINERIAKLCGWEKTEKGWWTKRDEDYHPEPPQYTSSRDACIEFELFTTNAELNAYGDALIDVIKCDIDSYYPIVSAARDRCEAFLRMKGQWDE